MPVEPKTVFSTVDDLEAAVGQRIGTGGDVEVTQELIDAYAVLSGDDQWIHIDAERAAQGPFGSTIAHGNLVLTLLPMMVQAAFAVTSRRMGLNYGLDLVRFTAPVRVGSRLSADIRLVEVQREGQRARVKLAVTINADTSETPVCIAEPLVLIFE